MRTTALHMYDQTLYKSKIPDFGISWAAKGVNATVGDATMRPSSKNILLAVGKNDDSPFHNSPELISVGWLLGVRVLFE